MSDKDGDGFSHKARTLTEEEKEKLLKDTQLVSEFKQQKLEKEAQKNWDLFYKRNTTKFFKDRHWTTREFQELCGPRTSQSADDPPCRRCVLEVGCGVGNFLFPLVEEDPSLYFYACDFSPRAVNFVKSHPLYSEGRVHAFQCDLTQNDLRSEVTEQVHLITMIFVLSAIHPDKMVQALKNIYRVLRPGGLVLFRDYGRYDFAQLRFSSGHKLGENFYVRQDGTRAYYFTEEELSGLFEAAGFTVVANEYIMRETVNKKEGLAVPRVFVQAKFTKNGKSEENEELSTAVENSLSLKDTADIKTDTKNSDQTTNKCPCTAPVDTAEDTASESKIVTNSTVNR